MYPYHRCTDDDYNSFYPVDKSSRVLLNSIKDDPDRGFFCINFAENEPDMIFGEFQDDNYYRLEVLLTPCNYLHTSNGYTADSISPECIPDLDKQTEYLGSSNWHFYMNTERINQDKYGDEAISRFSMIRTQQFNEKIPNWVKLNALVN